MVDVVNERCGDVLAVRHRTNALPPDHLSSEECCYHFFTVMGSSGEILEVIVSQANGLKIIPVLVRCRGHHQKV